MHDGVGEPVARQRAAHVARAHSRADGVVQRPGHARRRVRAARVQQHPHGRPDEPRRVGRRGRVAGLAGRAVVVHRAEHGGAGPVRGRRHGGRAAGQRAAHSAGHRAVQAGREQHVVPVGRRTASPRLVLAGFSCAK